MNTLTRRTLAVTTTLLATAGLAACSGDEAAAPPVTKTPLPAATVEDPVMAGLVGPGCAAYATQVPTGEGSVAGMGSAPLVTAARNNPLLQTLTDAVSGKLNKKVKLDDTLNGGEFTVFAPVDSAFAKLPAATLTKLKTDRALLVKVLTYHVITGRLTPDDVVGEQMSVEGGRLKVTGPAATLKVDGANVICGGIRTANATVYLIDTVLTPPR